MKKTNRKIAAALCVALTFTAVAPLVSDIGQIKLYASSDSGPCGENATYKLENGVLTISGTGETDQSYFVSNVPWDREAVTSIIVEDGITHLSGRVFSGSKNLKQVSIANSVKDIGANAFSDCVSLETVNIPDGVESIWFEAFSGCTALKSIYIPKSVRYIECNPFVYCQNLEQIIVDPENTVYHSNGNCLILTEKNRLIAGGKNSVIPSDGSVTQIDSWAFEGSGLTEINIPDEVTKISSSAFKNCKSLKTVTLPSALTEIPLQTFAGCVLLGAVTIPDSVIGIDWGAFADCVSLKEINLSKNVTEITGNPFVGCTGLESIKVDPGNTIYRVVDNCLIDINEKSVIAGCKTSVIPSDGSVEKISDNAFLRCSTLTEIILPDTIKSLGLGTFEYCTGLKEIILPDNLTEIGRLAFFGCSALTEIMIPASVTKIDDRVFAYCTALSSIKVEEGNPNYHASGNCLIETASGTLIAGCKESVIPSDGSVTSIENYAFQGYSELLSIVIPDGVKTIKENTFYECKKLNEIFIPLSVTTVEKSAFYRCDNIFDIYYAGTEEQWNAVVMNGADRDLKGTTIHYNYDPNVPLPEGIKGDINTDGKVDTKDLTRLMKMISVGIDKAKADVTDDGKVNTKDLTRLMKYLAEASV